MKQKKTDNRGLVYFGGRIPLSIFQKIDDRVKDSKRKDPYYKKQNFLLEAINEKLEAGK